MDSYIQITNLPTLREFKHEDRESDMVKVLAKSIALQLKPMNAEMTQFAFDRLLQLVDGQLNEMISHLHRMSNLQRRESIAKGDISMLMQGFHISPSSIDLQSQISQFYSKEYAQEFNHLHSIHDVQSTWSHDLVPFKDQEAIKQNVSTVLVPPTNPLQNHLPDWLPDLPPDHTYKFTPQYSHPITDETTIRRRIVEEGKQSEAALSHLSHNRKHIASIDNDITNGLVPNYDSNIANSETMAIYGSQPKKRRTVSAAKLFSKLPQTNFSVEEYAHNRVEIARKRVLGFEEKQLQLQQDPFLKLSRIAFAQYNDKITKRRIHRESQSVLRRSFIHLFRSIPELERNKLETEKRAKEDRIKRLQELKARKEQQQKKDSKEGNVFDLDELELDQHHEDFFANIESSDEETSNTVGTRPAQKQTPWSASVPTSAAEDSAQGPFNASQDPEDPSNQDYTSNTTYTM